MSAIISERFDDLGFGDPQKIYRLGIFGGTFDPIHMGHLVCAEQVRDALSLDAVIFLVAGIPVYKKGQQVSSSADRIAMCKRAIADNPAFDVSTIEVDRAGDTFTIDSLRQMREHYPENVEFYFIIGSDAALHVADWKESSAVFALARIVAVTRPNCKASGEVSKRIESVGSGSVCYQEVTALNISSSDLRKKVLKGLSVRYLTPDIVLDYINEQGLYRSSYDDAACGEA